MKPIYFFIVFTFICLVNGQSANDNQKLNTPIATLATQNGYTIAAFTQKTAEEILKIASPTLSLQSVKSVISLSTAVEKLLNSKSIADLVAYYDGFQMVPGISEYKVSPLMFIHMTTTFDSPAKTNQVVKSLAMLCGNASISSFLKTNDSALMSRGYLTDVYPKLLGNLPMILSKTRENFFLSISKLPEKYYRMIVKEPGIIDEILTARRSMGFAVVRDSLSKVQAAYRSLEAAMQKSSQGLGKTVSMSMAYETMSLANVAVRCNVSNLEGKSFLQVSLKCFGLPDDFPLLNIISTHGYPVKVFTTKLVDVAAQLNMPFESMIKLTSTAIMARYLAAKRQTPLHESMFFVARRQGRSIMDMDGKSLLDISVLLLQMNVTMMRDVFSISQDMLNALNRTKLSQLPNVTAELSHILYPTRYFYFLSMNSVIELLNTSASDAARINASNAVEVPINDLANEEIAKILGKTKPEVERMPLITFISLITNQKPSDIAQELKLSSRGQALLSNMAMKTAEEMTKAFIGVNMVLNRPRVVAMSKNEFFELLTLRVKQLARGSSLDATLPEIAPAIKHVIGLAAKRMRVNDTVLNYVSLHEVKFANGLTDEELLNRTVFGVLQDLAKMSKEEFPSPDFKVQIRSLSARKGIPLSSLKNSTFLDMIKRLTKSAWQIPLYLKSIKGRPGVKKYLKRPSENMREVFQGPIRGYDSYNFTISRLLDVFVGFDDEAHTTHSADILLRFLQMHLGFKEKVPLGIKISDIKGKSFLEAGLPYLLNAVEKLKTEAYVKKYFKNAQNMPEKLYDLLKSDVRSDVGELLYNSAKHMVLFNPLRSTEPLFEIQHVVAKMQKAFTKKKLKDLIRACDIKNPLLLTMTIKNVFQVCFNDSSVDTIKAAFNSSTLLEPFLDIPLAEIKDITGLGFDSLNKNLRDFMNAKTDDNFGILFTPLKDFFKSAGISEARGRNMKLLDLFMNPKFSSFNSMEYLKRKLVHGNNLEFLKNRSLEDLGVIVEANDKDFSRTNAYGLMRKSINLLQSDPTRCEKLKKIASLCDKRAHCVATTSSYTCRCDAGLDGDGFKTCQDKCENVRCPAGSTCITMPGRGSSCKCNRRWEKMMNGRCVMVRGHTIKVSKLKLKQVYKTEYEDKTSKAFKSKAAEIEDVLFNSVCKKVGCTAVIVTSIAKGSLVVDFLLVFSSTNVTANQVQAATAAAIKGEELNVLGADKMTQPQASQTDICQSGAVVCEEHEDCLPTGNGGYTCTCAKGYERKDSVCKKAGGLSFVIIIIIIIAAFVIIVTIIACVIWRWKRKRAEHSAKYSMAYNTNENETVQLTGGDYAFSYGGETEQKHEETA